MPLGSNELSLRDSIIREVRQLLSGATVSTVDATARAAAARSDPGSAPSRAGQVITSRDGVTIEWGDPGRIDARVRGAVGDGSTDNTTLLATLASLAASEGAELWIPEGTYRTGQISIPSNLTLRGVGTLKQRASSPSQQILRFSVSGDTDNVTVEGITFDGNATSAIVRNEYPNLVTNTAFLRCTFQNTSTTADYDAGIAINQGDTVRIEGCLFDCEAPIRFWNLDNLSILRNHVARAGSKNAIDGFIYGTHTLRGLNISDNTLDNCDDMGIELVREGGGSGVFASPIITRNVIHIADGYGGDGFGISLNLASGAVIAHNTIDYLGTGTLPVYGIEPVLCDDIAIVGNVIRNAQYGITVNKSHHVLIDGNRIYGGYEGIEIATDNPNSRYVTVSRNLISNPRDRGVNIKHNSGGGFSGGGVYEDNVIVRDTGWSGDGSRAFRGFEFTTTSIPNRFARNRIVQGMASPTLAVFRGFEASVLAAAASKSQISDTTFIDLATSPMVVPLYSVISAAADDVTLSGNTLTVAAGTRSDVTAWTT